MLKTEIKDAHELECSNRKPTLHIGLPLPRPIPGGPSPPDLGFLIVSSTDSIKHAASQAAVNAFFLTIAGSHTQFSKLSLMSSLVISTPYQQFP